ncbi:MAG: hypothetical protein FWD73_12340 [Polyangiaceae bacterium]|nr:hypothetical protein [Polyangiaceae bacterium]
MREELKEADAAFRETRVGTQADAGVASAQVSLPDERYSAPPVEVDAIEAIAPALDVLRAESDAAIDPERRARLLNEAGELQERAGDEQGAARDYFAAYNTDTSFREPLEGLVRVLERRRSASNLGTLLEALVAAAITPEERARALTERALFDLYVHHDLQGARGVAREATETGAKPADLGAAWLTLEMAAAELGDAAQREEALTGRAEATQDPTWRGLLLADVANLAAQAGDVARALPIAERARTESAAAAWVATSTAERIVRAEPGLAGSDEARERARALAEVLEIRATMLEATLTDSAYGDSRGVPGYCRSPLYAVFELTSASQAWRTAGDTKRATVALDWALGILARSNEASDQGASSQRESRQSLEHVVRSMRLKLAEGAGDTALAAYLATQQMTHESDDGFVASLAMRVADHAVSEGDFAHAESMLTEATRRDPFCAPAHAVKIDLLERVGSAAGLAEHIEELSKRYAAGDARGRALLLAAYVWAARAGNAARARTALGNAEACGVAKEISLRLARSLASLRGDDAWYEQATRDLAQCLAHPDDAHGDNGQPAQIEQLPTHAPNANAELVLLWVEIARLRLVNDDETGALQAARELARLTEGHSVGCVLEGFAFASPNAAGIGNENDAKRARDAVAELAEGTTDTRARVELLLVCALRAHSVGDIESTLKHLRAAFADSMGDPLIAAYLGDLLRAAGDRAGAAALALETAKASYNDEEQRGARQLEAGLEQWKLGDRQGAFATFEGAAPDVPEAAAPLIAWAARGIDIDNVDGRRRAIDLAGHDATVALERFALEIIAGNISDAQSALAEIEVTSNPSLRLAGALGCLASPRVAVEPGALDAALKVLAEASADGAKAAAAEQFRLARLACEAAEPLDHADVARAAQAWLSGGGSGAAAMEWLAAELSVRHAVNEGSARRALGNFLSRDGREAMQASATLLDTIVRPDDAVDLIAGSSPAVRLANLELSPPGCDRGRRALALSQLGGSLGEAADLDALGLAAWSALASGDASMALDWFRKITKSRRDDLHAWEGMRAAAYILGDRETVAIACEELGARVSSDRRGAAFWEQAALEWLACDDIHDARAEAALDASFARDATREVAFDKLFRRVRDRKDSDKLLSLVGRRLEVSDDPVEIAKLYWEMARVLREKGDADGALEALAHVTMFDEDHIGALALASEILIRRGEFDEAAKKLSHVAHVEKAPAKNRITAGIAAADLYENKLGRHDLALDVLLLLDDAKLTTLPVRERLARTAALAGSWNDATRVLEQLMNERFDAAGRIEAARLAITIHRDRRLDPEAALPAAAKLLTEAPTDGDALDLVVGLDPEVESRVTLLDRGRDALVAALHKAPGNVDMHRRLARVASALGDTALEQSALSCTIALSRPDDSSESSKSFAALSKSTPHVPNAMLSEAMRAQILAPGDSGPVADLFAALGETLAKALGPSLKTLGIHPRRNRVDPRATGHALRNEIAAWAKAFGITWFDMYVGGDDWNGVQGIAGETPAIVVGDSVSAPLSPAARAQIARELFAVTRGTNMAWLRDEATIETVVVAACRITKARVDTPEIASLAEIERAISKAISRKTKWQIEPICRAIVANHSDVRAWATQARASLRRVATLASGDVAVVLADVLGAAPPLVTRANSEEDNSEQMSVPIRDQGDQAHDQIHDEARALIRFVLSRPYFDLRRALGLEMTPRDDDG